MLQWSWKKFPPFWEVIHILQDRMYGEIFFLDLKQPMKNILIIEFF
jgi:hypothetical protein